MNHISSVMVQADRRTLQPDLQKVWHRRGHLCDVESLQPEVVSAYIGQAAPRTPSGWLWRTFAGHWCGRPVASLAQNYYLLVWRNRNVVTTL